MLNYECKHSVRLGQTFTMSIVHSMYLLNHLGTLTILLYCTFFQYIIYSAFLYSKQIRSKAVAKWCEITKNAADHRSDLNLGIPKLTSMKKH